MNLPLQQHGEVPGCARSDPRGGGDRSARPPGVLRIAVGIVSLFPGGGLQRNCLAIARILRRRGHEVVIFTSRTAGPLPGEVPIEVLPSRAWTNHGRNRRFAADLADATSDRFDLVVGFDKLSGLDLLYCADASVAARRGWRRLTPRHRALRALEAACFAAGASTRVIALSPSQIEGYRRAWGTEPQRVALLPPNIERERRHPERRLDGTRERRRAALGLKDEDWCWLAIGRQPGTKGFDRAIAALPAFPTARLFVIGLARSDPGAGSLLESARRLNVEDRLALLGFVADKEIPDVMAAADLLLHPARADTTGTVILEAVVNGLPVVTTAVCGYAGHVREADAGAVIPEPFAQRSLLAALDEASDKGRAAQWSANATRYGERAELYSGLEVAADIILRARV
jgi:UDP-glucose:(heptosyl)LPS alpha-1,3-glucosyltransferase